MDQHYINLLKQIGEATEKNQPTYLPPSAVQPLVINGSIVGDAEQPQLNPDGRPTGFYPYWITAEGLNLLEQVSAQTEVVIGHPTAVSVSGTVQLAPAPQMPQAMPVFPVPAALPMPPVYNEPDQSPEIPVTNTYGSASTQFAGVQTPIPHCAANAANAALGEPEPFTPGSNIHRGVAQLVVPEKKASERTRSTGYKLESLPVNGYIFVTGATRKRLSSTVSTANKRMIEQGKIAEGERAFLTFHALAGDKIVSDHIAPEEGVYICRVK